MNVSLVTELECVVCGTLQKVSGDDARSQSWMTCAQCADGEAVLDINDIFHILPHRYPFLMIDRVIDLPTDRKCTAIKNVSINEPYFEGHFPNHPVMPGVLQIEAMAQTASIIVMRLPENQGKIGYFMSANNVKFRRPVFPGDTLRINAELVKIRRNIGQALCECLVNGEVVSSGDLKFAIMDA